jgi:hypothetical protein
MTGVILHSDLFPDLTRLILRVWFKESGFVPLVAPPKAVFMHIAMVAVGGQGEDPGGNGAFSRRSARCTPGEAFQLQVGTPGTGGNLGDSWIKRAATGEVLCYADRGRGTGGVQGAASRCIGDFSDSGVAGLRSGGDITDPRQLGFGGRFGVNPLRAPGPGGGGWGTPFPQTNIAAPAGRGLIAVEFFDGEPGFAVAGAGLDSTPGPSGQLDFEDPDNAIYTTVV